MRFPSGFNITGIKGGSNSNLALITAPGGMKTAGVFTVNTCAAHPVEYSKEKIRNPIHRAILVNKGVANAATGREGKKRLQEFVDRVSECLGINNDELLVASTGVIGEQLEVPESEIKRLIDEHENIDPSSFAEAIMTTDTRPKVVDTYCKIDGKKINICGIAKGSGMVSPHLATMLAFILTDADIEKEALQYLLEKVTDISFNCLNIDNESSTNDTVFLAASGEAGNATIGLNGKGIDIFYENLEKACIMLVKMLAFDGEGATKLIQINIRGATDEVTARKAARVISSSPLCKTAFYGASPNWGRIVSSLGSAGIEFNIENFSLYINGITWIKNGVPNSNSLELVKKVMSGEKYNLDVDLNSGKGEGYVYTCDFSPEYVRINAEYVT